MHCAETFTLYPGWMFEFRFHGGSLEHALRGFPLHFLFGCKDLLDSMGVRDQVSCDLPTSIVLHSRRQPLYLEYSVLLNHGPLDSSLQGKENRTQASIRAAVPKVVVRNSLVLRL